MRLWSAALARGLWMAVPAIKRYTTAPPASPAAGWIHIWDQALARVAHSFVVSARIARTEK